MTPKAIYSVIGAVAVVVASLFAFQAYKSHRGLVNQLKAQEFKGEADVHVNQAQAVPEHAQELAQAKADVARARAEVQRLRGLVAAQGRTRVPDLTGDPAPAPGPVAPDHRDELLAADAVLIDKQDTQIQVLTVALADKTKQADEWHAAFDAERKRAMAQEAATEAWKQAVTASRWHGRVEGFAAGVALGYVAGRLR
jgi:hypothetical protein